MIRLVSKFFISLMLQVSYFYFDRFSAYIFLHFSDMARYLFSMTS